MAEVQVYNLQLLTFLVNRYDYQIVNIKGLKTEDFWLVNPKSRFPLICITHEYYTKDNIQDSLFTQVYHAIKSSFVPSVRCLILNTNKRSHPFETSDATQMLMVEGESVDPLLLSTFNGIDQVIHHVDDATKERKNLALVLQQKAREQYRKAMKERSKGANVTKVFMGICVAVYVVTLFLTMLTQNEITSAIITGALYKMNVMGAFEFWRLLTAGFVHSNLWHLLMNMMAFLQLGRVMERKLKKSQYITVLLSAIVVGNLFVLIGEGNTVTLGISGGLYGLLGVYTVYLYAEGLFRNPAILSNYFYTMMLNLLISMLPSVSMLGHLGGFVTGIALGFFYSNSERVKSIKQHVMIPFIGSVLACVLYLPFVSRIMPVYPGTDASIVLTLKELHLDFYADYLLDRYDAKMESQGDDGYREHLESLISSVKAGQ